MPASPRSRSSSLVVVALAVTAAVWCGVARIELNSDDYQSICAVSPVRSIVDVVRPFRIPDANPSYFRPVSAASYALNFLMFGWWGGGYHLTNLLLHLIATALVYFVARGFFKLREGEALLATLLFGLLASHDPNLTIDSARGDILAAIFVLLTLVFAQSNKLASRIFELVAFALALLSKEIAIGVLPLLLIAWWMQGTLQKQWKRVAAFTVVTILVVAYHTHFTSRTSQLFDTPSIPVMLRNIAFAIGYTVLPLDLSTIKPLLEPAAYGVIIVIFALLAVSAVVLFFRADPSLRKSMLLPLLLSVIFGAILCSAFERWRVYLPSVGFVMIVAVIVVRSKGTIRYVLQVMLVCAIAFYAYRDLFAEREAAQATQLLASLESSIERAIPNIPPGHSLGMLVSPTKLGNAGVWQLALDEVVDRAESNVRTPQSKELGTTTDRSLNAWVAVDLYSLDAASGYRGLSIAQTAPNRFLISTGDRNNLLLLPAIHDRSWRDFVMHVGDSAVTGNFVDVIRSTKNGDAKSIEVIVRDPSAVLYTFDGRSQFIPVRASR